MRARQKYLSSSNCTQCSSKTCTHQLLPPAARTVHLPVPVPHLSTWLMQAAAPHQLLLQCLHAAVNIHHFSFPAFASFSILSMQQELLALCTRVVRGLLSKLCPPLAKVEVPPSEGDKQGNKGSSGHE